MDKEKLMYVKKVYDEVVQTQLLYPDKLRTAANYILGREVDSPISTVQAKRVIYSFWNTKAQEMLQEMDSLFSMNDTDSTQTNAPEPNPSKEDQSHSEDEDEDDSEDYDENEALESAKLELLNQIEELKQKKEESIDTNEKRSLSMKINYLNKKLEEVR